MKSDAVAVKTYETVACVLPEKEVEILRIETCEGTLADRSATNERESTNET